MLVLEELLGLLLVVGLGTFFVALPGYKLYRSFMPVKRDPLKEAQARLEQAKLEAEAAHLNKETENIYNKMYHEALEEDESSTEEHNDNKRRL